MYLQEPPRGDGASSSVNFLQLSLVHYSIVWYSVPTTTSPNLFPVDGVVHRNIGSDFFVHLFVSLLVNKIL